MAVADHMSRARSFSAPLLGVASLAVFVSSLVACTVEPEPSPLVQGPPAYEQTAGPPAFPVTGQPTGEVAIVTGETLTSEPGQGAGMFVTYLGDGVWRVTTTCDTNVSGYTCGYAYTLRSRTGTLGEPSPDSKDGSTQLVRYNEGYDVGHTTSTAVDGLTVRVDPPGAPLEIAVWLDGEPDARLFYWVAPEGIQQGGRDNPTSFSPTAP